MSGVTALRKIQMGQETTAGTSVPATTLWRGTGTIEDDREMVFVDENIGILAPVDRVYVPRVHALLEMDEIEATFEQLPHLGEAGIKLQGTGVADTTGSGYIYTYPLSVTAQNTLKPYTLEGGDNEQAEEMEFALIQSFGLSGVIGEALKCNAQWMGRQVQNTTFTGAISVPVVEDILFGKTTFYVDESAGTIGTTPISNTLLKMSLAVNTGVIPVWAADGELYFSTYKIRNPEVVLSLTYEHNSGAVIEKGKWRTTDSRLLRLETLGTALETAGDHTYKTVRIDLAGFYSDWNKLGEQEGNDVYEIEFTARYVSADSLYAELLVVNELSAVP